MTRVLITGGCGFIGSNLVDYIIKNTDWNISILDNLTTGKLSDISGIKSFDERIIFFKGDLININDIKESINGCNYAINLAAQTSVIGSIKDPFYDERVNIYGLLNLLEMCAKNNVKKLIHASSAAVLGEQEMPINESKIPKPKSPYGASKLAGEAYCSAYTKNYSLSSIVLRFSNVYGPRSYNKGSVIAKFIKRIFQDKNLIIYGDGKQTRDFIYIDDICFGIYQALTKKLPSYEIIQLGTGIETNIYSIANILKELSRKYNLYIPKLVYNDPRTGEVLRSVCDISKAKKLLDFKIKTSINKGLSNTLKWFKERY